ncbi:hypothetical protein G4Y79_04720 [Phototrophicus methaneseepsis]|uniref:Uncharacterized protein n=1 Tax=Phototrophicus methaneseepsis TaxID=2710758 RepID=A0A7S8EB95_9CHLR|nr:hypothetical protein [Phototrophicus methaneseepsis]QPC83689.1 hypothetical protein G4Y79_04720 [Phototrophicus methaneseepsis]
MKISIWQQFSSNHSGFFWVVGTFKNVSDAQSAFDELRDMLFTIDKWHRDNRDQSQAAMQQGQITPLPPEQTFAEKYSVQWPSTIDWTNWAGYYLENYPGFENVDAQRNARALIDNAVQIVGRNVMVSSPDQTWMTIQPFEGILSRLGAKTIGYDMETTDTESIDHTTIMNFTAPNSAIADQIEASLSQYLAGGLSDPDNLPPWHDDEANFQQVLGKSELLKREYVDLLKQNWQKRYELHTYFDASPYGRQMPANRLALRLSSLQITRNNLQFELRQLWFHNQELGASALIAWLEANACTAIDYRYELVKPS